MCRIDRAYGGVSDEPWPPYCCVAAFVNASLRELGHPVLPRPLLARELGTRVGPAADNPWALPVEENADLRGVRPEGAVALLPAVFEHHALALDFRHVPFARVTLRLYDDFLDNVSQRGCVAGLGFDYSFLSKSQDVHRHVVRVEPGEGTESLVLLDDTFGSPPMRREVRWAAMERVVLSVGDGFWIIGPVASLAIDLGQ